MTQIKKGSLFRVPAKFYLRHPPTLGYFDRPWTGKLFRQLPQQLDDGTGDFYPTTSGDVSRYVLGTLGASRALRSVHLPTFFRLGISGPDTIPDKVVQMLGSSVREKALSFGDAYGDTVSTDAPAGFFVGSNQGLSADHHFLLAGLEDPTTRVLQSIDLTIDGGPVPIFWTDLTFDHSRVLFGEQLSFAFPGVGQPTLPGYSALITPLHGDPDFVYQNQVALDHDLPLLRQFSTACVRHRLVVFFYQDPTGASGSIVSDILNWFQNVIGQARAVAEVRGLVFGPGDSDDAVASLVVSEIRNFYNF